MKTRRNTKLGMCTIERCNDPKFRKVTFDKKVAVGKGLRCFVWLLSVEKLESLYL